MAYLGINDLFRNKSFIQTFSIVLERIVGNLEPKITVQNESMAI